MKGKECLSERKEVGVHREGRVGIVLVKRKKWEYIENEG